VAYFFGPLCIVDAIVTVSDSRFRWTLQKFIKLSNSCTQ